MKIHFCVYIETYIMDIKKLDAQINKRKYKISDIYAVLGTIFIFSFFSAIAYFAVVIHEMKLYNH
jgi:hypothetical protein